MPKRKAETELTRDNYLDGEDESCGHCDISNELKVQTREDMLKRGRPIIRLRRSSATDDGRRVVPDPLQENGTTIHKDGEEDTVTSLSGTEIGANDVEPGEDVEAGGDASDTSNGDTTRKHTKPERDNSTFVSPAKGPGVESPPCSIFGTLFSKPFTNPFAEAAKSGEATFASSASSQSTSLITVPQVFGTPSIFSIPISSASTNASVGETDHTPDEEGGGSTSTVASTPRPVQFPGEEDETEIFSANVVLLKCVPVQLDSSRKLDPATEVQEGETVTQPTKPLSQMKFKKQGEGILKLLSPKDASNCDKENAECRKRRLVVRQKGTWTILLNSPLWLSKKFEVVPPMASGHGVRFVGLDHTKVSDPALSNERNVPLAAYCIKFDTDANRQEFLSATRHSS